MFNIFNLFKKEYGTGALLDVRPEKEKKKDFKFEEIVAGIDPVNWKEKSQSEWRRFPIFDQDQSGSCVAMSLAKILGVMHQVNEGEWITFSPGFVYQQRPNKPGSGMAGIDSWEIARKTGILIEDLFPSQKKTDAQIDAYQVKDYEKEVAKIFRVKNYLVVPTKDIDTIASVIQKTNKAVMVWFYFKISEWQRNVPMVSDHTLLPHTTGVARHSVTAVDFTIYQGKKALIIDDSWGLTSGISGQRIITEDFFKARNFFAAYPINFKFAEGITPLPQHYFEKNLTFGQTNSDVVALQDALKWFGFFPTNTTSTGYYGSITAKAVLDWQKKFSVDTLAELERLQGKYFGPKSRKKMNDLL